MLSVATMVVPSAAMTRVTPFPSSRHHARSYGRSAALGGGRAWDGDKRGVNGGRAGLVVMARGKKEEPSKKTDNSKDAKGKNNKKNNNGKDQGKKGGKDAQQKNGTAVGTSALPSPGGVPLPALGGGLLLGFVILGKIFGGKGNRG